MSLKTAIATNLPSRPPPSSVVESVQRSPVLPSRITDPRQQRSGSVHPSSPPRRLSTPPPPPSDQGTENKDSGVIDMVTFNQILELDEDGPPYNFAWDMSLAYFTQAEETFDEMDEAIDERDCKKLYALGHFLKGSSATLGVIKVQKSCESIQHYGELKDGKSQRLITPDVALPRIAAALKEAREQFKEAKAWLEKWRLEAEVMGPTHKPSGDL